MTTASDYIADLLDLDPAEQPEKLRGMPEAVGVVLASARAELAADESDPDR